MSRYNVRRDNNIQLIVDMKDEEESKVIEVSFIEGSSQVTGSLARLNPQAILYRDSLARFTQIFEKEMDQNAIQYMYNKYTKRLHDCRRAEGQKTKY